MEPSQWTCQNIPSAPSPPTAVSLSLVDGEDDGGHSFVLCMARAVC